MRVPLLHLDLALARRFDDDLVPVLVHAAGAALERGRSGRAAAWPTGCRSSAVSWWVWASPRTTNT